MQVPLILSLLSNSAPAAPQIIVSFAKEESAELTFWYNSSGLSKLVQGRAVAPGRPETQANRDAKVARLEIYPGDITIELIERVQFAAVPYDSEGNAVGGVKVTWSAHGSGPTQRIRLSPQGELQPIIPGVFTITARAAGKSAQVTVTVRPGLAPNLKETPIGTRQVSTRDLPTAGIASNKRQKNSQPRSSKTSQRAAREVALAKRSHVATLSAPEPMPYFISAGWDSTNYWSADDPENRVGDPPGAASDGGAGSGNFHFAAPIYSASGRGTNISLGLAYNSRVWSKANTQMSYDNDQICSVIPTGRVRGASGTLGLIGGPTGGVELVLNYDSGQISAFAFGGGQVGWNGGASGSLYQGNVYGLNNSNSNYSGGFRGVNGSGRVLGGFVSGSGGVIAEGVSVNASLIGPFNFGFTRTQYSNPLQLGRFWAFEERDYFMFLGRQVACR